MVGAGWPSHEKVGNRFGRPAPGDGRPSAAADSVPVGAGRGSHPEVWRRRWGPGCGATASSTTRPPASTASLGGFTMTISATTPLSYVSSPGAADAATTEDWAAGVDDVGRSSGYH